MITEYLLIKEYFLQLMQIETYIGGKSSSTRRSAAALRTRACTLLLDQARILAPIYMRAKTYGAIPIPKGKDPDHPEYHDQLNLSIEQLAARGEIEDQFKKHVDNMRQDTIWCDLMVLQSIAVCQECFIFVVHPREQNWYRDQLKVITFDDCHFGRSNVVSPFGFIEFMNQSEEAFCNLEVQERAQRLFYKKQYRLLCEMKNGDKEVSLKIVSFENANHFNRLTLQPAAANVIQSCDPRVAVMAYKLCGVYMDQLEDANAQLQRKTDVENGVETAFEDVLTERQSCLAACYIDDKGWSLRLKLLKSLVEFEKKELFFAEILIRRQIQDELEDYNLPDCETPVPIARSYLDLLELDFSRTGSGTSYTEQVIALAVQIIETRTVPAPGPGESAIVQDPDLISPEQPLAIVSRGRAQVDLTDLELLGLQCCNSRCGTNFSLKQMSSARKDVPEKANASCGLQHLNGLKIVACQTMLLLGAAHAAAPHTSSSNPRQGGLNILQYNDGGKIERVVTVCLAFGQKFFRLSESLFQKARRASVLTTKIQGKATTSSAPASDIYNQERFLTGDSLVRSSRRGAGNTYKDARTSYAASIVDVWASMVKSKFAELWPGAKGRTSQLIDYNLYRFCSVSTKEEFRKAYKTTVRNHVQYFLKYGLDTTVVQFTPAVNALNRVSARHDRAGPLAKRIENATRDRARVHCNDHPSTSNNTQSDPEALPATASSLISDDAVAIQCLQLQDTMYVDAPDIIGDFSQQDHDFLSDVLTISDAQFMKLFDKTGVLGDTFFPSHCTKGQWGLCKRCFMYDRFKCLQENGNYTEAEKLEAKQSWSEHMNRANELRSHYHRIRAMTCGADPSVISLIMDFGSLPAIPSFVFKEALRLSKQTLRLCGVLVHNIGFFPILMPMLAGKGGDTTISVLHFVLRSIKLQFEAVNKKWPRKLHIQTDSCAAENKNTDMFTYHAATIAHTLFDELEVTYMEVGHTHEDIDGYFGYISCKLQKVPEIKTIEELAYLISTVGSNDRRKQQDSKEFKRFKKDVLKMDAETNALYQQKLTEDQGRPKSTYGNLSTNVLWCDKVLAFRSDAGVTSMNLRVTGSREHHSLLYVLKPGVNSGHGIVQIGTKKKLNEQWSFQDFCRVEDAKKIRIVADATFTLGNEQDEEAQTMEKFLRQYNKQHLLSDEQLESWMAYLSSITQGRLPPASAFGLTSVFDVISKLAAEPLDMFSFELNAAAKHAQLSSAALANSSLDTLLPPQEEILEVYMPGRAAQLSRKYEERATLDFSIFRTKPQQELAIKSSTAHAQVPVLESVLDQEHIENAPSSEGIATANQNLNVGVSRFNIGDRVQVLQDHTQGGKTTCQYVWIGGTIRKVTCDHDQPRIPTYTVVFDDKDKLSDIEEELCRPDLELGTDEVTVGDMVWAKFLKIDDDGTRADGWGYFFGARIVTLDQAQKAATVSWEAAHGEASDSDHEFEISISMQDIRKRDTQVAREDAAAFKQYQKKRNRTKYQDDDGRPLKVSADRNRIVRRAPDAASQAIDEPSIGSTEQTTHEMPAQQPRKRGRPKAKGN
jgi:hypothetical protein